MPSNEERQVDFWFLLIEGEWGLQATIFGFGYERYGDLLHYRELYS